MEMIITSIAGTFILTTLVWIIFFKNTQNKLTNVNQKLLIELDNIKSNLDYEVSKKLEEKVSVLNEQILDLKNKCIIIEKESYQKGKKDASEDFEKDYFVSITPYRESFEEGNDYLVFNTKKKFTSVGYRRQLFVKGLPVFDPVYTFLEKHEVKDFKVNEEVINKLVNTAISSISPPGTNTFIKVAENVIEKK